MELYASNLPFRREAWKAVRTCSPWEVHIKSSSCDQMNIWSMGVLVYFGHMDAITCKCILRVPYCPYGSVRTYRLENTHMINLRGCTEPAIGLYEARDIPYEVHRIQ